MNQFDEFLNGIENPENCDKLAQILKGVHQEFPQLEPIVKWNQPMFSDHGTYIIGFSVSKKHIAVSPEVAGIKRFSEQIKKAGYSHTDNIFRISWDEPVVFELLKEIIAFNIVDKTDATKFWR